MDTKTSGTTPFWVGIGASAGGLEALRSLAKNISPDIGAVYVVVQHMSPQHKSLLSELIGRETQLDVVEIVDNTLPAANTIYVAPPNSDVIIHSGRLRLQAPSQEPAAPKPSVDRFFRSLAESMGERAIGVVLSGTGSDGSYGVQAIRAAGGITIAQSKESAKYNGMPNAAVDTGCVDLVLSPEQIGSQFAKLIQLPRDLGAIRRDEGPQDLLSELFRILFNRTRVDFREYKPSTIRRRIERRLSALDLPDLTDYLTHVRERPEEVDALFRDLMISVTSFFRDKDEFSQLNEQIQMANLADKRVRVWIPGCATGEEAYSIALLLAENLGGLEGLEKSALQIFATDIDVNALATARRGFYPDAAMDSVPESLLAKYFAKMPGGYAVNQAIRDRVVFTPHNICQDPPFSNIDLISCRNLLIYFGNALQAKVMARLHYALNVNGLLFLGKSESIGGSEDLFRPTIEGSRIFKRRVRIDRGRTSLNPLISPRGHLTKPAIPTDEQQQTQTVNAMFDSLVRSVGPNALLVTSDMHIRRVYGNIDKFVSLSEGMVRGATVAMLRDHYRHEVRSLITMSMRQSQKRTGVKHRFKESDRLYVQIEVHPLNIVSEGESLLLVVFNEWEEEPLPVSQITQDDTKTHAHIAELERELDSTRDSLQQAVEELETTNEELQSLNEEMQSANEELQSTNEELETANEELQSTNEELITVNEELQINSHELTLLNQELDSILANIAAPILVVDNGLHIVRCSQSARAMFRIEPGVGKPHLSQSQLPEGFPSLANFMSEIIRTGAKLELEIETPAFRGSVTAAPYFNPKGELIGATAIITDTAELQVRRELEMLLNHVPAMIWRKDDASTILDLNEAAAQIMGLSRAEAIGMNYHTMISENSVQARHEDLAIIDRGIAKRGVIEKFNAPDGQAIWLRKDKVPYNLSGGRRGLYVVAQDISPEYRARIELGQRQAELESILEALPVGVDFVDVNRQVQHQNQASRGLVGPYEIGAPWSRSDSLSLVDQDEGARPAIDIALSGDIPGNEVIRVEAAADQDPRMLLGLSRPVKDREGTLLGAVQTSIDVTDLQNSADALHRIEETAQRERQRHAQLMALAAELTGVSDWQLDLESGALILSEGAVRLLQAEKVQSDEGMDALLRCLHPDDRNTARHGVQTALREALPFTIRVRLATGEHPEVLLSGRPERGISGEVTGVLGLVCNSAHERSPVD